MSYSHKACPHFDAYIQRIGKSVIVKDGKGFLLFSLEPVNWAFADVRIYIYRSPHKIYNCVSSPNGPTVLYPRIPFRHLFQHPYKLPVKIWICGFKHFKMG